MLLRGQRALITGATGGLGPVLCETFLALGANVIAVSRTRTRLIDLRSQIQTAAPNQEDRFATAECDVCDAEGVAALFESVEQRGPLDAVVHAVGAFRYGAIDALGAADIRAVVQQNLLATSFVVSEALGRMKARGAGRVIVVASDRVFSPDPAFAMYGAAKAGVTHLVTAASKELRGPTLNAVLPGIIDTPQNRSDMGDGDASAWVPPQEIAKTCAWLAGDDARWVNGALITMADRS